MKVFRLVLLIQVTVVGACLSSEKPGNSTAADQARQHIEAAIARGVEATKNEDIDGYMEGIPEDYAIYDESGQVITREQMRANALRDWSVISRTLELTITVDSLMLISDSVATVYTSQRWERMMTRPDRPGEDTILTTQRHRETWRLTGAVWRNYDIDELGGAIFINGTPFKSK